MLLASRDTVSVSLKGRQPSFIIINIHLTDCLRTDVYHLLHGHSPRCYRKIPVPLNLRECRSTPCIFPQSDRTYPNASNQPLYMPPSTTITFFPLLTQRNPALWGDDADNFDPERWIDPKRMKKFLANPTMFTPFSAGPRIVSI
jgi:hypothetical protein